MARSISARENETVAATLYTPARRFLPLSRCARPQTALALQSGLHNIGWTLFLVVAYLMVQIVCKAYKACPRAVPLSPPAHATNRLPPPRTRKSLAPLATAGVPVYFALLSFLPLPGVGTQSMCA